MQMLYCCLINEWTMKIVSQFTSNVGKLYDMNMTQTEPKPETLPLPISNLNLTRTCPNFFTLDSKRKATSSMSQALSPPK